MQGSFGLSKLKKDQIQSDQILFYNHIIIGHDKYCVNAAEVLLEKFPDIKLLVIREQVEDLFDDSLCSVRGEENISVLKSFDIELRPKEESVFYKDLKFHQFGKRTKPEVLQNIESFYTNVGSVVLQKQFLSNWKELALKYPQVQFVDVPVMKLIKTNPEDLINQNHYQIELTNHQKFSCENLVWGHAPYTFLKKIENKSILSDSFIEFCETTQGPMSLSVKFSLDTDQFYQNKTFFIPLSYTHQWGHFIGEFINSKEIIFVHYIGDDSLNKEDVEKWIRLLKRQLNKAFEKFDQHITEQQVKLDEESPSLTISDNLREENTPKGVCFVGENSPLCQNSLAQVSNYARGLLSIQNLKTMYI